MDHLKTASPYFSYKNMSTKSFMKVPISVTGMITHGHVDNQYVHYGVDLYPSDLNYTVDSLAKVLWDLEDIPKFASKQIFPNVNTLLLFNALLEGGNVCNSLLFPAQDKCVIPKSFPLVLNLQLDNACLNNKNRYILCFFSLLVAKGVFQEMYVNFISVSHTHDDIDALFGWWSMRPQKHDYPTILLMKSFKDGESKKFWTSRASLIVASTRKETCWTDTLLHSDNQLFWIARALINVNSKLVEHPNCILIQYWKPTTSSYYI